MNSFTSIDYSNLLSWISYYKYNRILNRTQMQKLLYICYGVWLGVKHNFLFEDDSPKAWPFGPVFPRVNKRYNPKVAPTAISDEMKKYLSANKEIAFLFMNVAEKLGKMPANDLVEWSHQIGGPWSKTIYGENLNNTEIKWNQPIPKEYTEDFFKEWEQWLERKAI